MVWGPNDNRDLNIDGQGPQEVFAAHWPLAQSAAHNISLFPFW